MCGFFNRRIWLIKIKESHGTFGLRTIQKTFLLACVLSEIKQIYKCCLERAEEGCGLKISSKKGMVNGI